MLNVKIIRSSHDIINPNLWSYFTADNKRLNLYYEGIKAANGEKTDNLLKKLRHFSLMQMVEHIRDKNISGHFAECGVWKGGSAMLADLTLLELGETSRKIYLYDTYNGMPKPTSKDIDFYGVPYTQLFQSNQSLLSHLEVSLDEVRENMFSTGYPKENLIFIKGMVEDTLSSNLPHSVAVLRLDTDFYESTYYELQNLYPKVSPQGVLIIDDYGHFHGAKEATDKYFNDSGQNIFFQRVDYACRVGLKA